MASYTTWEKKWNYKLTQNLFEKKYWKNQTYTLPEFSRIWPTVFFSIHKSFCVLIQNLFFLTTIHPQFCYYHWPNFFSLSVLFGFNSHHLTKKCVDCKMKMKMLKNRLSKILMIGSIFHSAPDSVFLNRNVKFDT